jgi:putative FmdB family regulatory protein
MPLYDFYCKQCEKEFESLSKPYDPVKCPACGTYPCERTAVTTFAGYSAIPNNSASQRPSGAGSFKRKK